MARRAPRTLLLLVVVAAVVAVLRSRLARGRAGVPPSDVADAVWPPLPESASESAWVEPRDGACPVTHPVKAKVQSGIFHAPGSAFYDRTRPDRCYRDEAAAEADGLRAPRR